MTIRALLVDDDPMLCETLAIGLRKHGADAESCTSASEALARIDEGDFDVVVTDLNMREMGGIELCERIVLNRPDLPVVVLTAFGSLETAVAAIRAGAYDFMSKPVELETFVLTIERAGKHRLLREEVKRLRREASAKPHVDELIGDSAPMQRVHELVARASDADASILVTGESGTGKEVVARALHRRSRRRDGPFVAINCAAVPEALLESELFGHVRGAFTDAKETRPGLFLEARGGTLFLDEIGDMPLALQPKLLRVLQERTVRAVGGKSEVPVDVRVVAATNRDLQTAIDEKRFREDLYYRVNVIEVSLPPLRARASDVVPLAVHFLKLVADRTGKAVRGISQPAAEKLASYAWPGNVRELQNCIERAVALTQFEEIRVDDLPERVRDYRFSHVLVSGNDPSELVPLEEVERRYILRVLEAAGGNKSVAARILGMERKTLYRKLERYE